MINFFEYINTDEFLLYGMFFYYIILPGIFFLLLFIFSLISNYSEFRAWKKNKREE